MIPIFEAFQYRRPSNIAATNHARLGKKEAAICGEWASSCFQSECLCFASFPRGRPLLKQPEFVLLLEAKILIVRAKSAAPRLPKQNPQGAGTLGGSCLELRPLRALVSGGQGTHRSLPRKISGAALQTTNALWCNAIAPWYAAVPLGRPAPAGQSRQSRKCHIKSCSSMGGNASWSERPATEPKYLLGTYSDPILAAFVTTPAACSAGSSRHRTSLFRPLSSGAAAAVHGRAPGQCSCDRVVDGLRTWPQLATFAPSEEKYCVQSRT
jgi:hypothetical protein